VAVGRPIVASIKEQLGLRVVPARGTVEILGSIMRKRPINRTTTTCPAVG
jgi:hypothetical protein